MRSASPTSGARTGPRARRLQHRADRDLPARIFRLAPRAILSRLESAIESPDSIEVVMRLPEADAEAREQPRAERGGLEHARARDRDAEQVGLVLHQPVVGGRAAIHFEN